MLILSSGKRKIVNGDADGIVPLWRHPLDVPFVFEATMVDGGRSSQSEEC